MRIIIVQGMACLGKSSLCEKIEKSLYSCKWLSVDKYKEVIWDKFGFYTVQQRDNQAELAMDQFYVDLDNLIAKQEYRYLLLDYAFTPKYWNKLIKHVSKDGLNIRTIYLKPANIQDHKRMWEERSRDFSQRHPAHGASIYADGIGSVYVNCYEDKFYSKLPVIDPVLEISVEFNPYYRSISFCNILQFIKGE